MLRYALRRFLWVVPSVFGAEVTIGATEARPGPADPDGRHLVILARCVAHTHDRICTTGSATGKLAGVIEPRLVDRD